MAGFSRINWYEKELGSVPGKPAKKGTNFKRLIDNKHKDGGTKSIQYT